MSGDIKLFPKMDCAELKKRASCIRNEVIQVCVKNGAGHIAPSLSSIEILTVLYYRIMNISSKTDWNGRDRLVFSKGHGCYGLYAILADIGYIDRNEWLNFYQGSSLPGCIERNVGHGIEASCGALGHGLPIAVGLAFGARLQRRDYRVYVVMGDGEAQEGSNWEAIQFAAKYRLDNLTVIVDANRLQAMALLEDVLTIKDRVHDLKIKFDAFGCRTSTCDGHDVEELVNVITAHPANSSEGAPHVIIANTVKGRGLKCMENVAKFHFRIPTEDDLQLG